MTSAERACSGSACDVMCTVVQPTPAAHQTYMGWGWATMMTCAQHGKAGCNQEQATVLDGSSTYIPLLVCLSQMRVPKLTAAKGSGKILAGCFVVQSLPAEDASLQPPHHNCDPVSTLPGRTVPTSHTFPALYSSQPQPVMILSSVHTGTSC